MNKLLPLAFTFCLALAGMQVPRKLDKERRWLALMDRHRLHPSGAGHLLL